MLSCLPTYGYARPQPLHGLPLVADWASGAMARMSGKATFRLHGRKNSPARSSRCKRRIITEIVSKERIETSDQL